MSTNRGASVDELRAKLRYAEARLDAAHEAMRAADAKHETAHEMGGGIPGFGGSGNQRAAGQVRSALDSAQRAWNDADERIRKWDYKVNSLKRRLAEIDRRIYTRDEIVGAGFIHDGSSWRKVVRVNAKTVSVVNWHMPEWEPERIPFDKVHGVQKPLDGFPDGGKRDERALGD